MVPWTISRHGRAAHARRRAAARRGRRPPRGSIRGVEETLCVQSRRRAIATTSVNVPPMSTPTCTSSECTLARTPLPAGSQHASIAVELRMRAPEPFGGRIAPDCRRGEVGSRLASGDFDPRRSGSCETWGGTTTRRGSRPTVRSTSERFVIRCAGSSRLSTPVCARSRPRLSAIPGARCSGSTEMSASPRTSLRTRPTPAPGSIIGMPGARWARWGRAAAAGGCLLSHRPHHLLHGRRHLDAGPAGAPAHPGGDRRPADCAGPADPRTGIPAAVRRAERRGEAPAGSPGFPPIIPRRSG